MNPRRVGGVAIAAALALLGTYWALSRGGNDFAVFHSAARWVVEDQPAKVYYENPDRFLYAPGFAWLTAPLGALPFEWALALWCALKAFVLVASVDRLARACAAPRDAAKVAAIATLLVARPVLIDFQYGQVNLLILGACVWALYGDPRRAASWFALGALAVSKLMALPLLLVPWLEDARRARRARAGAFAGAAFVGILPFVFVGLWGGWMLLMDWKLSLELRGFPLESHNQSFAAFLHHYFSGQPTWILMLAQARDLSTGLVLDPERLRLLSSAWGAAWAGVLLGWLVSRKRETDRPRWAAVAIALLVVPSYLAWKPYFLMALPVAAVAASDALAASGRSAWARWAGLALACAAMNLSTFDLIGRETAARLEASSIFLVAHLTLIALAVVPVSRLPRAPSRARKSSG